MQSPLYGTDFSRSWGFLVKSPGFWPQDQRKDTCRLGEHAIVLTILSSRVVNNQGALKNVEEAPSPNSGAQERFHWEVVAESSCKISSTFVKIDTQICGLPSQHKPQSCLLKPSAQNLWVLISHMGCHRSSSVSLRKTWWWQKPFTPPTRWQFGPDQCRGSGSDLGSQLNCWQS